jgi:hypothetical protein
MSLRPVLEVLEEWGLHHAEELQEADCKAVIVRSATFGHCRTYRRRLETRFLCQPIARVRAE